MVMVEMVGLDGLLFLKSSFETILPSPSWLQKTDATRKDDTQHLLGNHKTSSYHKPYYFQTWYHQDTQNELNLTQKWATEPEVDLKHNHGDHRLVCVK